MVMQENRLHQLRKKAILKFDNDGSDVQDSKALISISVGEKYHEGDEFLSLLLAVEKEFPVASIIVVDTLQRHSLSIMEDKEPKQLHQKARELGDAWIDRNIHYIESVKTINRVMRWDEWLDTDRFLENYQHICYMYENNSLYNDVVNETIEFFIYRFLKRHPSKINKKEQLKARCLEYLKEECAVMPLWVSEGFHYEIYPKLRNEAMKMAYELLVKPFYPNLLKSIHVKFKKIASRSVLL